MRSAALGALLLSACVVDLEVDDGAEIVCHEANDCRAPLHCELAIERCVGAGYVPREPARPVVAFITPENGAMAITRTPVFIVVFTLPVERASLEAHVTLAAGEDLVPLRIDATGSDNTWALTPPSALSYATPYTLTIAAGVLPTDPTAVEMAEDFVARFTTEAAPDTTPPGPVSALSLAMSPTFRTLRFTLPADGDFAGVLVLRSENAVVAAAPAPGVTYAAGATIGNAKVVGATQDTAFVDLVEGGAFAEYALVAFDRALNYGEARRPPRIAGESLRWCPDQSLRYLADSPDVVAQHVHLAASPGTEPLIGNAQAAGALGVEAAASLAGFALGQTAYARVAISGPDGVAFGVEAPIVLASATLAASMQPKPIGPGGTTRFVVARGPWPALEAEVDASPLPNVLDWGKGGLIQTETQTGAQAVGSFPLAGKYAFRFRPVDDHCPPGLWTESDPVQVGSFAYVVPGGAGDQSGKDPENAEDSIDGAYNRVDPNGEIYVAAGVYDEALTLVKNVSVSGGWDLAFTAQDRGRVSRINGTPSTPQTVSGASVTLDMLHFGVAVPAGSPPPGNSALAVYAGATLMLTRSTIICGEVLAGFGLNSLNTGTITAEDNDFFTPATTGSCVLFHFAGQTLTAKNNRFVTPQGASGIGDQLALNVQSGDADVLGNEVNFAAFAPALNGFRCVGPGRCKIEDNTITLGNGGSSVGLRIGGVSVGHVAKNRVYGGFGVGETRGFEVDDTARPASTIVVENNFFHGGDGTIIRGAILGGGARVRFSHNVVLAGGTGPGGDSAALVLSNPAAPSVADNVLFTVGTAGVRQCVRELSGGAADPLAFVHNLLFACPSDLYVDEDSPSALDIAGVNALVGQDLPNEPDQCSTAMPVNCEHQRFAGNITTALTPAEVFFDLDGPDNQLKTVKDVDLRLLTSAPATIRGGGSDPLMMSCGTLDAPALCSPNLADYAGVTRTCGGVGVCTAIGAREETAP
ncbi:MAG: Ig-like domain-containing protein [Deltaproteobacteria bacterium]|nr:Ig-like domain-containing protein [Deltaproteobacteria bacterium]